MTELGGFPGLLGDLEDLQAPLLVLVQAERGVVFVEAAGESVDGVPDAVHGVVSPSGSTGRVACGREGLFVGEAGDADDVTVGVEAVRDRTRVILTIIGGLRRSSGSPLVY